MEGAKIDENLEEKMRERIKKLNDLVEIENSKLDKLLDMYI
jgi:low affinity Fe/Cu permease